MYVDTHAGTGGYKLDSGFAEKTGEYLNGIGRLWSKPDLPGPVADYIKQVQDFNYSSRGQKLGFYPGSPWLAQHLLRADDRLVLNELHPADFPLLHEHLGKDNRIRILQEDGYQTLNAVFPPIQKRGLALIDPSYEQKQEYQWVAENMIKACRKFSTGTYALWYPVVRRELVTTLEKTLAKSRIPKIQLFELGIAPDNDGHGMTASGMIVINPPWTLMTDMQNTLPWLAKALGEDSGHWRAKNLTSDTGEPA